MKLRSGVVVQPLCASDIHAVEPAKDELAPLKGLIDSCSSGAVETPAYPSHCDSCPLSYIVSCCVLAFGGVALPLVWLKDA